MNARSLPARVDMPPLQEMTVEQRQVYDDTVAGRRGKAPAPLRAWLHSPVLAQRAQSLGEFLRYETSLAPRLSELAILVTARRWSSQYEWYAHKKEALKAGVEIRIIDAIMRNETPDFVNRDEQLVYDFSMALHVSCFIPDDLYAVCIEIISEQGVVELVGILGYYTFVAMTLNTFRIGLPDGIVDDFDFSLQA